MIGHFTVRKIETIADLHVAQEGDNYVMKMKCINLPEVSVTIDPLVLYGVLLELSK